MTYNFDPDRWYERERSHLDRLVRDKRLSPADHRRRVAELDRRLADMWRRLDPSYQLPKPSA
jgi:hypothetical protein